MSSLALVFELRTFVSAGGASSQNNGVRIGFLIFKHVYNYEENLFQVHISCLLKVETNVTRTSITVVLPYVRYRYRTSSSIGQAQSQSGGTYPACVSIGEFPSDVNRKHVKRNPSKVMAFELRISSTGS